MAFLIKSALGEPSGKLGNIVFRRVNGKVVIATAPDHYTPSNSPRAQSARNKFAAGVQFAAFINSSPELKEIWARINMKARHPFNRIFQYNYPFLNNGYVTPENVITPAGKYLEITNHQIKKELISIDFRVFPSRDLILPVTVYAAFAFYMHNIPFVMYMYPSKELDEENTLKIELNSFLRDAFNNDPEPVIFISVVGSKLKEDTTYWTSTAAIQINDFSL